MSQDITYLYAPITKSDDSSRHVVAPISGPNNVDLDGQIVDLGWLRSAVPHYMKFGNVRQAHDSKRPVGKAVAIDLDTPDGVPIATIHVVDDNAWNLTKHGVLSGVSVGIKNARVVRDADAPKGRIVGGDLVEISLVDHPANTNAKVTIMKSVGGDAWLDCESGEVLTDVDAFGPADVLKGTFSDVPAPDPHPEPRKEKHSHGGHEHKHTFIYEDHMHCPTCGEDVATCSHGEATEKGATGFDQFAKIEMAKPQDTEALSPEAPSLAAHGNVALDGGALVRHQYLLSQATQLIKQMAGELKGGSHFNPNDKPAKPSPESLEVGATPADAWAWDGKSGNAAYDKGADVDELVEKSFGELFGFLFEDPDVLTKSAEPGTIKAAFLGAVTRVATQVANEAVAATEERLAKIESMAAPGKGYRNEVVERQLQVGKSASGQPLDHDGILSQFGAISEKLSPNEKTALAADWISGQLRAIAPH